MSEHHWLQVRAVFEEVVDLSPVARQRYLSAHYAPASPLRLALEQLLAGEAAATELLESPVLTRFGTAFYALPEVAADLQHIGPYRIERELGRGGMGVVYLAVRDDDAFRKQVAIKLVWPGLSQMAARFRQERQILADLEHPHIARLLDGGATAEGWQYLVMEYVEGLPLKDYCTEQKLPLRVRLQLFLDICAAVQHAHQHLIIHRDLKPGNILVTSEGQVKLLDFGIAKALDASAYDTDLSLPGTHLMTPEYASPEQLLGTPITTASDIYSLGVVLFELLTEQRPFQFASRQPGEVARLLSQHAPPRMSQVAAPPFAKMLRGDLDNIVTRALQHEPQARYDSVAQFAEDLRRHLNGEVVIARKPTLAYRAHRFVRRHHSAFIAGTIIAAILSLWLASFVRQVRQERVQAQTQRRQLYAAEMRQAQEDWKNNDLRQMQQTLAHWQPQPGEEDLRGFEWRYLQRLLNASALTITLPMKVVDSPLLPSDNLLTAVLEDSTAKVFDATTGQELRTWPGRTAGWIHHGMYADNRDLVRVRDQQDITIVDLFTGATKYNYHYPHGPIEKVHYYRSDLPQWRSHLLITEATGALSLVDMATNTERFRLAGQGQPPDFYSFSLHHDLLATVTAQRTIRVNHIAKPAPPRFFTEPRGIRYIEISEDGRLLLVQTHSTLQVRDIRTGQVLHRYPGNSNKITSHTLSDKHETIALGKDDGTIEIRAFPNFRLLQTVTGHLRSVTWVGFTPDPQHLLSTSMDRTVRFWDWRTGQQLAVLGGHADDISAQQFVAGKFMTRSLDRTIRVWDFAEVAQPDVLHGATDHILTVAFAPDGQHVAAGGKDNNAIIHDIRTGTQQVLRGHRKFVYVTRFSPDGRWLVTGSDDGTAKIWDTATGRELQRFVKGEREYYDGVRSLAFLNDQRTIAFGGNDGTLTLWDTTAKRVLKQFRIHTAEVLSVALSPDGKLLATAGMDHTAKLWDTTTWQERAHITAHQGNVWTAVFSPDGKQLATGSGDQTIKLWDVATKQLQRTLTGHNDGIFQVAYTPDGKRLASVSDDQTVKIWNLQTGQDLLTLREHTNEVWGLAFSPDGNTLVTGSWDKTLRLWRAVKD